MKKLLAFGVVAGVILAASLWLSFLDSISANSILGDQSEQLFWLNGLIVLGLLLVVGWQIWRLVRDYRRKVFGVRLKLRLALMFGLVALLPGALVYGVAVQFVTRSIESWFDVRVEKALEAGLDLGRSMLDSLTAELTQKTRGIRQELEAQPESLRAVALTRLREQIGVDSLALFDANGRLIASAQILGQALSDLPDPQKLKQARTAIETETLVVAPGHFRLRVLLPLSASTLFGQAQILQAIQDVPPQLAAKAEAVQAVYDDYRALQLGRVRLTHMFATALTLTMLASLLSACALAFVLARRLSTPISLLAAGTQAVAQGNFAPLHVKHSRDELGVLTRSFNRMTEQLAEAEAAAARHRHEVEAARAYLETILANLSAGVLAFDRQGVLRTINEGAIAILGPAFSGLIRQPASAWSGDFAGLGDFIRQRFAQAGDEAEWQGQQEIARAGEQPLMLLLRGTRLSGSGDVGYVVVFDDVTKLIAAQRSAAWGEVARRLAHEIKNPLTPIQLSAERLSMKLADRLVGKDKEMLERATQTIVNQVRAMQRMVDDFRDYSRRPAPELTPLDLNALIREVLGLYENAPVHPETELDPALPPVLGDANLLRQIIHNLVKNGEDALEGVENPRLALRSARDGRHACLEIVDNGRGFPVEILSRAFEPYVTTKPRGTGLGLAIVKKIIDEHHGRIVIENPTGGGACIRIWLPLYAS